MSQEKLYKRADINSREFVEIPQRDVIERCTVGSLMVGFVRAGNFLHAICQETGDLLLAVNSSGVLHESYVSLAKKKLHVWDAAQAKLYGHEWNARRVERRGLTPDWWEDDKEKAPTGVQSEGA